MEQIIAEHKHDQKQTVCNQPNESIRHMFPELSKKKLNSLRCYSTNIAVLGLLWGITFIILIIQLTIFPSELVAWEFTSLPGGEYGRVIVTILLFAGAVGCFGRWKWARYCGIIISSIMLPIHYLITIFGIFGLVSFIKGKRLFGTDGLNHNELFSELKYRKKYEID